MRGANRVLGRPAYCWKLTSIDGKMPVASCGLPIPVDGAFDSAERQDALILIAAFEAVRYPTPPVLRVPAARAQPPSLPRATVSPPPPTDIPPPPPPRP